MSSDEVDAYLAELDEPRRSALQQLRGIIRDLIPEAEEGLSYGVPVFRIGGKNVVGYSAAKKHLSYLPHSGAVLAELAESGDDVLAGFETTKGALKFPVDRVPPTELVDRLIAARRTEAGV